MGDCQDAVMARGWCRRHYNRWHKYGDPAHLVREMNPSPPRACAICGKPTVARGWCVEHYYRWRRHGDPLGTRHPCPVCISPERFQIEMRLLKGERQRSISDSYGISFGAIGYHSRKHLNFKKDPTPNLCEVCQHPEVREIELAQENTRPGRDSQTARIEGYDNHAAIARRFGVKHKAAMQHHAQNHAQKRVIWEAARLAAVREWVTTE